jgi:sugar lactone lactonase YvrE
MKKHKIKNQTIINIGAGGVVLWPAVLPLAVKGQGKFTTPYSFTTIAGKAIVEGSGDGMGSATRFAIPSGAAVDSAGNVYVADDRNCTIRKLTLVGTNWVVTTLVGLGGVDASGIPLHTGSADGTNSTARFSYPDGVAVDSAGNVYVADQVSQTIRKVTPVGTNWVVTTLAGRADTSGSADGTGSAARFNLPTGVALDSEDNVYVADWNNNTIRKGSPALVITSPAATFGSNGRQFGFDLAGPAGKVVVVEASTDLVSWLPLWTNTLTDALHFTNPESGVDSHPFCRIRTP